MNDSVAQLAQIPLPTNRRDRSYRLRQESLILKDSERWGAVRIHRELERRYGEGVVSQRAVSKWIADKGQAVERTQPVAWRRWQPDLMQQDAGYLLRLDLVSRGLLGRGLYEEEARWATRLELALQGRSVFAQWAVIEEYARRHLHADDPTTDDLDLMLAARPWRDDGLLERSVRRAGVGTFPTLRMLTISEALAAPISETMPLFDTDFEGYATTVLTPTLAGSLFEQVAREHVHLRIVLHIGAQLFQPVHIRSRYVKGEGASWKARLPVDLEFSVQIDPHEDRVEKTQDESELLLVDLFQTPNDQRRRSDGE